MQLKKSEPYARLCDDPWITDPGIKSLLTYYKEREKDIQFELSYVQRMIEQLGGYDEKQSQVS